MSATKYKLFKTKATSIDEDNFTITFKVSDSSVDRENEIVSQKDWQMDHYLANPVMLFGHDPSRPDYIIGQCIKMEYNAAEDAHYGTYKLDADFNPTARLIWNQLVAGTLRTVSLGFINHSLEWQDDIAVLTDIEPVETSVVAIPANAGALAKSFKAGNISRKDMKFLMDTMRSEADLMEEQMNALPDTGSKKEKSMTPEQAQAVIDGMARLSEQVTALTTEHQSLREEVTALKPAEETEEEKSARETKEAEDKAAAEKADVDKKAEEEEAARKAAEDAKTKEDLAKSGDNDQDGAKETDELDDDAELTPELQEQIDTELAALVS